MVETSKYDLSPEMIEDYVAIWHDLDGNTQDDLESWYNRRDMDDADIALLALLHERGEFVSYDCGHCGTRVRQGYPQEWAWFQGVCQDGGAGQLCADCYCLYEQLKEFVG